MTMTEKVDSLSRTLRRYPEYAANAILAMGMDWDGKALYNKHANELEEQLVTYEKMIEKLVNETRYLERIQE
jgi:hypothetical protein